MGRYDWWADDPRGYPRPDRFAPEGPPRRRPLPRPPHWWGDPFDPRYAGFELHTRYDRDRHDHRWNGGPFEQGPESQPSRFSRYGRWLNDEELSHLVRRRLYEDTSLAADSIQVDVDDGIVTLSGEVEDYLEARYAWDDAWETEGVEGVISRLTVRTHGRGSEGEQDSG
jgi:BON domain